MQPSKSGNHNISKLTVLKPQSISHEILSIGTKEPNVYLKLISSLQEFSTTSKLQYLGSSEQNKARHYPLKRTRIISGDKVIL